MAAARYVERRDTFINSAAAFWETAPWRTLPRNRANWRGFSVRPRQPALAGLGRLVRLCGRFGGARDQPGIRPKRPSTCDASRGGRRDGTLARPGSQPHEPGPFRRRRSRGPSPPTPNRGTRSGSRGSSRRCSAPSGPVPSATGRGRCARSEHEPPCATRAARRGSPRPGRSAAPRAPVCSSCVQRGWSRSCRPSRSRPTAPPDWHELAKHALDIEDCRREPGVHRRHLVDARRRPRRGHGFNNGGRSRPVPRGSFRDWRLRRPTIRGR